MYPRKSKGMVEISASLSAGKRSSGPTHRSILSAGIEFNGILNSEIVSLLSLSRSVLLKLKTHFCHFSPIKLIYLLLVIIGHFFYICIVHTLEQHKYNKGRNFVLVVFQKQNFGQRILRLPRPGFRPVTSRVKAMQIH